MLLLLGAVGVLLATGLAALGAARAVQWPGRLAVAGVTVAGCLGLLPAGRVLLGGAVVSLPASWDVPYGAFAVALDPLSAFFLLPILVLSVAAAFYGHGYLGAGHTHTGHTHRSFGPAWFFFNLLIASMVLVLIARNGVLFLMAWKVMALASFFLVTFDDERPEVREAGRVYLMATHFGTAFLLALFVLLGSTSGSLDFDRFGPPASAAGLLFALALVGFGTKAGFMPLHVWLPEAHPAAPSYVSALMSGVMIKTGIYGLLRTLTFLGAPPAWWGWVLCGIGLTSGVGGILFALSQRDLKRVLAYSSVENIGIIALGLGVGFVGATAGSTALAAFGFCGALLHVLNHAVFKGLLFLGAGAVAQATGTLEIDRLGGVLKWMPRTGVAFLIAAVAIAGLPPLSGFAAEFLIYVAAFTGVTSSVTAGVCAAAIGGLALIGGLAAACFTRAFGMVFLGAARGASTLRPGDPVRSMQAPMAVLAAGCVLMSLGAPLLVRLTVPVVEQLLPQAPGDVQANVLAASDALLPVVAVFAALGLLVATVAVVRRRLLARRTVAEASTWDCGYAQPSPQMQYTASSFSQPLTDIFGLVLGTRRSGKAVRGLFPADASFATETPDVWMERVYAPVFSAVGNGLAALRWLQHGRVHLYVLYLALTLVVLMVWTLG